MGDLGKNASYGLTITGFAGRAQRSVLGQYDINMATTDKFIYTYSEPLAFAPYTYKKQWDGFVFDPGFLSSAGQLAWPNSLAIGYMMMPELSGTLLNEHIFYRVARIDREWAGVSSNGSLVLNHSAQPFLAFETLIMPFEWISFSSLTGVLEYDPQDRTTIDNKGELKSTAMTSQSAFSIVMLEANIKNYVNIVLGSSVVWPKRFELGYAFPFAENFLYQNNVGDFDNLALFLNLQGQYPGIGKLWLSIFLDEMNPAQFDKFWEMDRMLYAFQIGTSFNIPWLPFASIKISYTKNEPYNYTHPLVKTPYNSELMEQNFVNFGRALGHYIPPNSDELLIS